MSSCVICGTGTAGRSGKESSNLALKSINVHAVYGGLNKTQKTKNPAAVALGKLGAGKPKNFSPEEIAKRTARLPRRVKTALLNVTEVK